MGVLAPYKHVSLASSQLLSVAYDETIQIMEIEFVSGGIYQYHQVSSKTYYGLLNAESYSTYFEKEIRGRFSYERMDR